jgi:acetyl esterase/lipase
MKSLMHFAVFGALAGVLVGANLIAQTPARVAAPSSVTEPMEIPLWPGVAPGSEGWTWHEQEYRTPGGRAIRNIVRPTLTPFLPDRAIATGTAIIVAPGGGNVFLTMDREGYDVARWLAARGVAAFVLKYRLNHTPEKEEDFQRDVMKPLLARMGGGAGAPASSPSPSGPTAAAGTTTPGVADGQQAVRIVRRRAAEWGIAPNRIGIMGFSAGAGVTMGVALNHDAESRPDFLGPIYGGLRADTQVPSDAAPIFAAVASDDPVAQASTLKLYSVWKAAGVPIELHVFESGGHGWGMRKQDKTSDHWVDEFGWWLESRGLIKHGQQPATEARAGR